jgi:SAM-dependent methyltransferase
MHQSSYDKMARFRQDYLKERESQPLKILDIGSQDVNGTYKPLFHLPNWEYRGADMSHGENVDIILDNPYRWSSIAAESYDVVISGQAFEHIEYFWITMLEITRILKPGGICCIIAPAGGFEHRYPVDCYRFYADGFTALAKWARLEILCVFTQWESQGYADGSDVWQDSCLIARKPIYSGFESLLRRVKFRLVSSLMSKLAV